MANKTASTAAEQKEFFENFDVEGLKEVASYFGVPDDKIPENATKKQLVELLQAAKRKDIAVAQVVRTQAGKELECPPGHMIIKVTPKAAGLEWGKKSREVFFFGINGVGCAGKRGVEVVISDKYRSCWIDAIKYEYESVGEPFTNGEFTPAKFIRHEVPSEDVQILHWNRDLEAEAAIEREIVEGSKKYLEEKKLHSGVAAMNRIFGNK